MSSSILKDRRQELDRPENCKNKSSNHATIRRDKRLWCVIFHYEQNKEHKLNQQFQRESNKNILKLSV